MEYTLLINDKYAYPLSSYNTLGADGDCSLIIQANDLMEVKQRFSDISSLKIFKSNTLVSEYTKYNKYSGISLGEEYYDAQTGNYYTTMNISLAITDLADQVANISKKLNTNIDYNLISLPEYKKYRINQSKEALAGYLEEHPLLSSAHNNVAAYYSVTKEKQDLMTQQYLSYQIAKAVDPEHAVLTYNATGEVCEVWQETEFLQLIMEVKAYVYPLVSYQQTVEKVIMDCNTKDEVSDIIIDYSSAVVQETANEE